MGPDLTFLSVGGSPRLGVNSSMNTDESAWSAVAWVLTWRKPEASVFFAAVGGGR